MFFKVLVEYYNRKALLKLHSLYEYENQFSQSYPSERYKLVQLYPNLCKCLTLSLDDSVKKPLLPLTIYYALRSFGLTTFVLPRVQPFDDSFESLQYKSTIKKVVSDSDKTKVFNDLYGLLSNLKIQNYECSTFKQIE